MAIRRTLARSILSSHTVCLYGTINLLVSNVMGTGLKKLKIDGRT